MLNIWGKKVTKRLKDNRAHTRLEVYHLAKYRLADRADKDPVIAYISNISGGGVRLQAFEEIPVSSIIQLSINVPGIGQPVSTTARICWSKKISKRNAGYEYGIQFLDMDDMARRSVIDKIGKIAEKFGD